MRNMRLFSLISTMAAVIVLAFAWGRVSASAQNGPGGENDPLVSKRYVDEQFNQLKTLINSIANGAAMEGQAPAPSDQNAIIAQVLAYVEEVYGEQMRQTSPGGAYTVVQARQGQTVYGVSGTEMILRGGSATVVSGINGLCDVTAGADIINGQSAALNHLLLVPGDDNRGLKCTSDAYLMIKGGYYIAD